jgi:hypothetical protein
VLPPVGCGREEAKDGGLWRRTEGERRPEVEIHGGTIWSPGGGAGVAVAWGRKQEEWWWGLGRIRETCGVVCLW